MEKEILETSKELSPIIVAIIGSIAGLISGTVASLIAPWVHYAIESKKEKIKYQGELIKKTRNLLDTLISFKELRSSSMWGFIFDNLNDKERKIVFPNAYVIEAGNGPSDEMSQDDFRKQGISLMLSRLEKEWKLTKV